MVRVSLLCALLMSACGGGSSGSGVTGTKKLVDLSASERDKMCAFEVDAEGGARTVDCPGGTQVTIHDKATCLTDFAAISPTCTATVKQAETCFDAVGMDPCNFGGGACTAVLQCFL